MYSVVFAYIYMIYNKLRCFAEGLTCFGYVYIYIYIYIYMFCKLSAYIYSFRPTFQCLYKYINLYIYIYI